MNADSKQTDLVKQTAEQCTQFQLLATAAHQVSMQLERGQAETPISSAFESLIQSGQDQPLHVSLLCFQLKSKETLWHWLVGQTTPQTVNHNQLMTVQLNLEQTIEVPTPSIAGWADGPWQNVQLTIADSLDQLRNDTRLYQQFSTRGHLFMFAATADHVLSDSEEIFLSDLAESFSVVWPIVVGAKTDAAADLQWTNTLLRTRAQRLEPFCLLPTDRDGGGAVLSDVSSPLRQGLLFERRAQALSGAVTNLADRHQRELNSVETRRKLLGEPARGLSLRKPVVDEKALAVVRDQFSEQLVALEKQINLKSDRATQPLGLLTNLMRENSQLTIEDLDKEQSPSLLKLSVNGSHLATVNRTIEHALRQELTNDVATILSRLQQLTQQASNGISQALGGPAYLSTTTLLESRIWRTVENLMAIGKESHIELARKGVFDMLTAGRQKVFILIMFVSLMGRMGLPNLFQSGLMRTGFGLFMASVLISSMVNAVFVWRREKKSQSEKELSKIKETLFNDGTKVIEQVEKGKLTYIREYLREVGKDFEKQLKQAIEEQGTLRKTESEAESQRQEANRKKLDQKIKSLSEIGRQIATFTTDVRSLHTSAQGVVREAARQHVTLSPGENSSDPPTQTVDADTSQLDAVASIEQDVSAMIVPKPQTSSDLAPDEEPPFQPQRVRSVLPVSALARRRDARRRAREQGNL